MNLTNFFGQPGNIVFVSFCFVAGIQIFYYLFFFSRVAFYKFKKRNINQTHPVSVIICARDEAANIAKNLPGALVQKYNTTHEVIVVNDNSIDESRYVLEEYQRTFKQLKIVELKQEARFIPGKKFPLSVGIKTARHEIVLLTDADCVPATENWIEKMQERFSDGIEIVLGYGAFQKRKGLLNKLIRWEGFHTALQYFSYAQAGIPYMGVGRNLSYKKQVFFRHKGFTSHNHLPGGDDDLFVNKAATKQNTTISVDCDTFTITEPPHSWKQWKRQKARHYSASKYYKRSHKILLGVYALTLFLFYPLFVSAILFFDWRWVVGVFLFRFIIQNIFLIRSMKKLGEKDLAGWILFFDIWMFFYYLIFAGTLFKRAPRNWK